MRVAPGPAVRMIARLELRRRWPGILALGLAGAVLAGGLAAVLTMQWRTDSAYDRLTARSGLEDVRISLVPQFSRDGDEPAAIRAAAANAARFAARASVERSAQLELFLGRLRGPGVQYVSVATPVQPLDRLGVPVVVRGRAPDPRRPDEVIVHEERARAAGLGIGDQLRLDLLTPRQFQQFSTGIGRPAGGAVLLRVVGVFRYPDPSRGYNSLVGSPAFGRAHAGTEVGRMVLLRTRGHASGAGFAAQAAAVNRTMTARFGPAQQPYVAVESPRAQPDPGLGPTRAVLRTGLLALAAVVLGAGGILVFQVGGRWADRGRESQQVEDVLGLRRSERVTARVLAAAPAALLGAAGGVAGALLGARAEPLGTLRRYEPDPGWLPNAPLAVAAGAVGAVVVLGVAAVVAASAPRGGRVRGPARAAVQARAGAPLTQLARALARSRGGPDTALPARSVIAALAAVVAVTVVVADAYEQLAGIGRQPARWGWTADFEVVDDTPGIDARLRTDDRVQDVEQLTSTELRVRHGRSERILAAYGRATLRGQLPWTIAAGRLPRKAGEIALGPRAAHDLTAGVGDRVIVSGHRSLRVVGVVVVLVANREPLGRNVLLAKDELARLSAGPPYSGAAVRATSPAAARSLIAELGRDHELERPVPPDAVAALDELGRPARILLTVLALALLLLVTQAARLLLRRRRSQLAIAHVLGLRPPSLVLGAVTALLAGALVAVLVGVPLGWALARLARNETGPRLGLAFAAPGWGTATLVAAGVVASATLLGAVAAAVAVRRLRTEPPRG